MKRRASQTDDSSRRGVALIIVLGFLSIMIMMAVAFLTQARTERMVANSTLEAQRGRQLVRSGLTAAMNDYSIDLFGQRFILPPAGMDVFESRAPTGSTQMPGGEDKTLGDSRIRLMAGEARRWLPRRYLTPAVSNKVANAEWILVREDPRDRNSPVLGRYAYACFDMSGGIDANLVALTPGVATVGVKTNGPAKPIARSSIRDVGLGLLPETADAGEFKRLRRGWHGFDNLAELILLTNGKYNGGEQDYEDEDDDEVFWAPPKPSDRRWREDRIEYSPALTSSQISDLVPYSLAAYRGVYDIGQAKWNKPRLCEVGTDWTAVLTDSKLSGQVASVPNAVKAILDYLDPDSLPQGNPDYPSVEAVPMFNEMGLAFQLRHDAAAVPPRLFLDVTMRFETWYPFPSADNDPSGSYSVKNSVGGDLQIGGGYGATGTGDIWMRIRLMDGTQVDLVQNAPPSVTPGGGTFTANRNAGRPLVQTTFTYNNLEVVPVDTNYPVTDTVGLQVAGIRVQNPISMYLEGGAIVDQMRCQIARGFVVPAANANTPVEISVEVDDPRLNHDLSRWTTVDSPSLDQPDTINPTAISAGYGSSGGSGYFMYCRNAAMKTPAELGYVPTGTPWGTIDLCTPAGADALSGLVTEQEILDAINSSMGTYYTNGTINPNTTSSNVLISAFAGLNLAEVPNVSKAVKDAITDDAMRSGLTAEMTNDWAAALAASMMTDSASKKIASPTAGGAFLSGADWVRTAAMKSSGLLAGQGLNKNQRESLIRNTWGLFSPNNSLFTVLVIGQAIREGPGQKGDLNLENGEDMITGERRGVALVWRDPYPSTGGYHHEMFVRMFKFLDE